MSKKMTKEDIAKQKKRERDARYRAKKREAKKQHTNEKNKRISSIAVNVPEHMQGMFHSLFTIISSHIAKDISFFFRSMDIEVNKLTDGVYRDGFNAGKKAKCKCGKCHKKGAK